MKQSQIFENGEIITHYTGVFSQDVALCGQDLAGDSANYEGKGSYYSNKSDKKVNCKDCLKIVIHCKSNII